jgi:hypothetical protein
MAATAEIFRGKMRGDQVPDTLRDQLLAIPGIDDAELEGDVAAPAGVRVRLTAGADPQSVGREVQRILAEHGMRSQVSDATAAAPAPPPPPPPPPPPGTVVNLADYEDDTAPVAPAVIVAPPVPATEVVPAPPAAPEPEAPELPTASIEVADGPPPEHIGTEVAPPVDVGGPAEAVRPADDERPAEDERPVEHHGEDVASEVPAEAPVTSEVAEAPGLAALSNVAVIEGHRGVTVTVAAPGVPTVSRVVRATAAAIDEAVVSAVLELSGDAHSAHLVASFDQEHDGDTIVIVIMEGVHGDRASGAAMVAASRPWAVARATRAALSELGGPGRRG